MKELKIKVCGMRDPENISGIVEAAPDFMGFIFYPKSSRFVGTEFSVESLKLIPESVKKVGVFVNELPEDVIEICRQLGLQAVQLHGNELPEYGRQVQRAGLMVIKAFSVDENFDFEKLRAYYGTCSYFLFDTKGNVPGGTGRKFNWPILEKYKGAVPFFLSGGIKPEDLEPLRRFSHPRWRGIDINSGFEVAPALKDVEKVKAFIEEIRK